MTTEAPALRSVCVFCGSQGGARPEYLEAARALGVSLARREITTVYGGGHIGMMGAVADAALAAGGRVVGVIPEHLMRPEVAHQKLDEPDRGRLDAHTQAHDGSAFRCVRRAARRLRHP